MDFNTAVNKALQHYPINLKKTYLLRHNENYTLKVISHNKGAYVLRIHISNNNMQDIGQHTYEALNSELIILSAIRDNTDIKTQKPILNNEGVYVTEIELDETKYFATLIEWINGDSLDEKNTSYEKHILATGIMLGKLHNFFGSWKEGLKLSRPEFNSQYMEHTLSNIQKGIKLGLIDIKQFDIITEAMEHTKNVLDELSEDYKENWYGISHCDVSSSNLIVDNGIVTPIDFSLATKNYFFFDIAGFIADLNDEQLTKTFISGYRQNREFTKEMIPYVETFFVQSIFGFMSFHVLNKNMHSWFDRRLDRVIYDYVMPVLDGKRFLF